MRFYKLFFLCWKNFHPCQLDLLCVCILYTKYTIFIDQSCPKEFLLLLFCLLIVYCDFSTIRDERRRKFSKQRRNIGVGTFNEVFDCVFGAFFCRNWKIVVVGRVYFENMWRLSSFGVKGTVSKGIITCWIHNR